MTCPIFTISPHHAACFLSEVKRRLPDDVTATEMSALIDLAIVRETQTHAESCLAALFDGFSPSDPHPKNRKEWVEAWLTVDALNYLAGNIHPLRDGWKVWANAERMKG